MKQTAVEWLFDNLNITGGSDDMKAFEQAKAMEKEQIEKTFEEGMFHHINGLCPDEYYNETFKSE